MTTTAPAEDNWMTDDIGVASTIEEWSQQHPWKILIVDDEPDVHSMTRLALRDVTYRGRPLALYSAYTAAEGYTLLQKHPDTAIVLLDVVMESDDAGWKLARQIRKDLANPLVRIVLRTGQPGHAPEEQVIVDYDINDYKSKTELTTRKLFVVVLASLRTYESLLVIDQSRLGLRRILKGTENLYRYSSLQEFSSGVLAQINAILDVGADGVLCAQRIHRTSDAPVAGYEVVAATGQYADLPGRGNLGDDHVFAPLVRRAFDLGHSFFEHPYDVLHFAARNGYRFVIVFTPPWPLEDFQKDLLGVFCDRMASAFDNLFLYQQLRASNEATVIALADLAEFRDESTGAHIVRVKKLTNALVAELVHQGKFPGIITETFRAMIGTAAILHDVGKVATPDHILLKPGKHTPEEREVMKEHARHGELILEKAAALISGESYLAYGAQIAGGHHECFDGSGYPRGLSGQEIPLAARIVAAVDVFDALIHRRPYKDPWPLDQALAYMRAGAGSQFDPDVLGALLAVVEPDPQAWVDPNEL